MAYITTVNGQTYTIDTDKNGQQRRILLDGKQQFLDWRQITALAADSRGNQSAGGCYSIIMGGRSYNVYARRLLKEGEKESQTYEILIAGLRFEVRVEDERTKKLAGLAHTGQHSGEARIQAPMPGLVVNIAVEAGSPVEMGQPVIILEAMKMENDLPAPITGKVKEICVNKGQAVDQGQVLAIIEGA